ncbi:phosphoribosylglycinamide formyltransferase [Jatrophihabitans sp. DSM 45814]
MGSRAGYAAPGRFLLVPARLLVLASGSGTTLQAVLDAVAEPGFPAVIVAAGTDRPGCQAMKRAADAGVATFAVALGDFENRADWDQALLETITAFEPDLVVLAGFMRVIAGETVQRFKMVNTHPSLLPSFPGAHAISDALTHGVKITGVTVHRVDAGLDSGPILAQVAVPVLDDDTEDTLRARIQEAEKPLFIDTIRTLCISIEESSA